MPETWEETGYESSFTHQDISCGVCQIRILRTVGSDYLWHPVATVESCPNAGKYFKLPTVSLKEVSNA